MGDRKRHWFWNMLVVITILVCALAFIVHAKNWTRTKNNQFKILSGLYYKSIPFSEVTDVAMVEKIPSMERVNGFSAYTMEKGVFKDSLSSNEVYVFVDDLRQSKIKLVYKDSLQLFLNYSDSTKTAHQFTLFKTILEQKEKE